MPSAKFMKFLYDTRSKALREHPWHYENPDCSPLCMNPVPRRFWDGGAPKNKFGMCTTANPQYVTCKNCKKIMSERGIGVNESA
jgi:hypothetical protein